MNAGFTHVEGDGDDVEAHGGVSDAAEGRGLKRQEDQSTRDGHVNPWFLLSAGEAEAPKAAHPVDFGQFVPPPAPLVSPHQL